MSNGGRAPSVPREKRIELYEELAHLMDHAAELAEALQLPEWRRRVKQYERHASAAREERDHLQEILLKVEAKPGSRRGQEAARKRQERRARSERTADAMMLPGGVNSLAWKLLHGDQSSERSEDSED